MKDIRYDELTSFTKQYYYGRDRNIRPISKSEIQTRIDTAELMGDDRSKVEASIAVHAAYQEFIETIASRLAQKYSVLCICDKALTSELSDWICQSEHLRDFEPIRPGRPAPTHSDGENGMDLNSVFSLARSLYQELSQPRENPNRPRLFILEHLDLMTTSLRGESLLAANDIVYWLSEFKREPVLAFADPSLPLPKAIEDIFTEKFILPPIQRGELHRLLRPEEARRISRGSFKIADQLRLYQYVSGLNVIRLRWLMQLVGKSPEPSDPTAVDEIFQLIRKQTTANDMVPTVSATDLAGYEDVKKTLTQRVIHPIEWRNTSSNDRELAEADLLVPRGIILYGPPRNGKTEMAKWLATVLQWPISIIRGPELRNKFLGETERAIRSIFTKARQSAPSLILIDELDAITATRRDDENRADLSMVAMLLTEMDGLNTEESVLVIGTTNRLESVDPAFKAPGRFGLLVKVDYPNSDDRLEILKHYRAWMNLVDLNSDSLQKLVEWTEGYLHPAEYEAKERLRDALMTMYPAPVLSTAETEIRNYLNHRLGISQLPKWSCDHLRGVCQEMLVEIKNDSSKPINDESFLKHILSTVRGSENPSARINSALVLENLAGRSWRGD